MNAAEPRNLYLAVSGILSRDGNLRLLPAFQTESPSYTEPLESSLILEQIAGDGRLLASSPIAVSWICLDGLPTDDRLVIGKVPFHAQTRSLRFVESGREILKVDVPNTHPNVRLTSTPEGAVAGRRRIAWEGSHDEALPLRYAVFYSSDGAVWHPVCLPLTGTDVEIDFDALPGGDGRIAVLATDGVNTTRVESATFRVSVKPCLAVIFAPLGDTRVDAGQRTFFAGQGCYMEERAAEFEQLTWSSSIDGEIGSGALVEAVLSPGSHTVTLTAGRGERAGKATTSVIVERATKAH